MPLPIDARLNSLTAGLGPSEWRLLGALALEQGLARSVLVALDAGFVPKLDPWLRRHVASGLLVSVGPTRVLSMTSAPSRELGYAIAKELQQPLLRELGRRGELVGVAQATQQLLGGRSVAAFSLCLQLGDDVRFAERFVPERLPRQIALRSGAAWLRAAICEPFDPDWFLETWGERSDIVGIQVLSEAAEAGAPCGDLYGFLQSRLPTLPAGEARVALASSLCEHAVLRGEHGGASRFLTELPRASGLGYAAALAFAAGDQVLAQQRLDELFGAALQPGGAAGRRGGLPHCGSLMPLLALLLCARDDEAATALAKRLVSVGTTDAARGAARAFRQLQRYLESPEAEHQRIDVHGLPSDASLWETWLVAHNAELHQKQPETRARWAQHLAREAQSQLAGGYVWAAQQTVQLARGLSAEHTDQELERQGIVTPGSAALSLWDLVAPKPEWQKTLQALSALSESVSEASESALRVAWFVDMADGGFSRPALCEHRPDAGGWSAGRRCSLAEVFAELERLPPEDQRVLSCTRELAEGRREFLPEAHERLIGHPRVYNGARGNCEVEVVRGNCRIEADEEPGYLRVSVEPAGAKLGVNLVAEGDARLVVYRVTEAMQRVIEVLPHGIRVPLAEKPRVLGILGKLSQSVDVQSAALVVEELVNADVTPCLRLAPHAGAWLVQAGVRPFGSSGRFFVAGSGRASLSLVEVGRRLRCERDFERERQSIDQLVAACPTLASAPEETEGRVHQEADNWVLGEASLLSLLSELARSSVKHELEWPERRVRLRGGGSAASFHGRLRVNKGWYLATGGLRIDDVNEATLAELVHAPTLLGGRFVRLANGDWLEVEERVRRVMTALASGAAHPTKQGEVMLHPGSEQAMQELGRAGLELDGDARSWLERIKLVKETRFEPPDELQADLRGYQQDGFRWLCQLTELGLGACLADDMGLGKTVQILALLLRLRERGPALVVAPTSVCSNWAREAARFAPSLTLVEYTGDDRAARLAAALERAAQTDARKSAPLVICSYALLQQDQARLTPIDWASVVLDEAQFIKNPHSLRAQAAFRLKASVRIAATGTPVENHAADLWSIFQFINPGLLGELADFNRRFVKPIDREAEASPEQVLRRVIQPYVLRRLKRDVLQELPPLTELSHEVELSADETLRYAVLRKQVHDKLFTPWGKRENKLEVLAELTRLRRFCCHPRLVFPDADQEASKISAFLELVEELRENGHRALVFSQFVDFLEIVRDSLDERRIRYEYLDGSTPQAERQKRVDAFQNGDAPLFLISLKAGGFGLNLTAADYVIHLDPWWNPAVEAQATDRAHRIGQERRVTVYRLIVKDTIEQKIVELHAKKRGLSRALLDDGVSTEKLSITELLELIETGAEAAKENGVAVGTAPTSAH